MKKSLSLAVTAFLFCLFVLPCFAAGTRPVVEVMWTDFDMNSVGGVSPQIWYRSNSDKTIKYIEWHLTAYNAVGDPVKCDIRNRSSIIAETVGPIYKTVLHSNSTSPYTKTYCADKRHMEAVKRQDLFELAQNQVFWMFDAEVFKAFGRVFILTYLSDGCVLTSYLNINHIKYGYYHVEQTDTGHQFKEGFRPTTSEQKQRIKSLLNIYEGPLNTNYLTKKELNSTAKADSALSKSWFDSKKSKIAKKSIEQLKNNAVNYISHIRGAYKNECLWSTFKQYANKFDCPRLKYRCAKRDSRKGNGCLGCQSRDSCRVNFLACNCRATNKFKDKTVLIYLLNIYPSPVISDYLAAKGYPLDADTYALAQLLQWIWRSAIREDKPVYLYLPSSRLRKLLYQYLNDKD